MHAMPDDMQQRINSAYNAVVTVGSFLARIMVKQLDLYGRSLICPLTARSGLLLVPDRRWPPMGNHQPGFTAANLR